MTFELGGVSHGFTFLKTKYTEGTHIRGMVGDQLERKEGGSCEGCRVPSQGIQNVRGGLLRVLQSHARLGTKLWQAHLPIRGCGKLRAGGLWRECSWL